MSSCTPSELSKCWNLYSTLSAFLHWFPLEMSYSCFPFVQFRYSGRIWKEFMCRFEMIASFEKCFLPFPAAMATLILIVDFSVQKGLLLSDWVLDLYAKGTRDRPGKKSQENIYLTQFVTFISRCGMSPTHDILYSVLGYHYL